MVEVCVSGVHVVIFLTVTGTHVVKREVVIPPAEVDVLRETVVEKLVDVDTEVEVRVGVDVHDVAMFQPRDEICPRFGEETCAMPGEEAVVEEGCQVERQEKPAAHSRKRRRRACQHSLACYVI